VRYAINVCTTRCGIIIRQNIEFDRSIGSTSLDIYRQTTTIDPSTSEYEGSLSIVVGHGRGEG
jgi:hypothetical protein